MTDILRINNLIVGWNSASFYIDGLDPYNGITSINYEQKRERKVVYGMRRDGTPLGKTSGKYSVPNVSITFLRDSYDKLTTYLTLKGLGSYGDAEFAFSLLYSEPKAGTIISIIGTGCTIDGEKDSQQEGTDELVTEVEIGCLSILRNGKPLYSLARNLL